MKLGVYVGSFDPVHKGHIKIVNYLLDKYLDKVIIVPTGAYWDKTDLINVNHRINMLNFFESDRIIIEEEKNNLPCTYMIMEYLSKKYKDDEFYFIMGADNIIDFDKWDNYKELLKYNFIIIARADIDVKYYLKKLGKENNYLLVEDLDDMDVSSTTVRNLIKENKLHDVENLIDKQVLRYIIENNLYKD